SYRTAVDPVGKKVRASLSYTLQEMRGSSHPVLLTQLSTHRRFFSLPYSYRQHFLHRNSLKLLPVCPALHRNTDPLLHIGSGFVIFACVIHELPARLLPLPFCSTSRIRVIPQVQIRYCRYSLRSIEGFLLFPLTLSSL